jgi:hypothetical protein
MELSIRAYAKHRGVSESAVRKAINQGRISKDKNGKINPINADNQWNQNTDPAQIKSQIKRTIPAEKPYYVQNSANSTNNLSEPSYQQSRAIKEAYTAKLIRLQFEKESKKLISFNDFLIDKIICTGYMFN